MFLTECIQEKSLVLKYGRVFFEYKLCETSVKNETTVIFDGKLLRPTKRLLRRAAPRNDGGELVQSQIAFFNPADFAEQ